MIYHHNTQMMIPSSNELAKQFKIARSTVRLALEKMTEEGYLTTRRGIGTFTVPMIWKNSETMPLIGVRIGSGDQFHYDAPLLHELGQLFIVLSKRRCNVRLLTESGNTVEEFADVLDHAHIDALITISVPAELSQLAAQRMPVVCIGFPAEGVNSIVYGGKTVAEKLAELPRFGKKLSLLCISCSDDLMELFSELSNHPRLNFTGLYGKANDPDYLERVKQTISTNAPDLILYLNQDQDIVRNLPVELNPPGRCRLFNLNASIPNEFPADFQLRNQLEEAMALAADELLAILAGQPDRHFRSIVDYQIIEIKSQTENLTFAN